MCGICGLWGKDTPEKTAIMLNAISHRGPDGSKIVTYSWGSLGFCRLDIFGSAGINQPATSKDEKIAIVFNGEIYNFKELTSKLPACKNINDEASLILELYLLFEEKCFAMLKGMFAISIMTPDKVLLARDAVGIKPLVYYTANNCIYFASEIKALLRIKDDMIEIDDEALAETAVFGFIFGLEKTMFKWIKQVLPGCYIKYENNKISTVQFHTLSSSYFNVEMAEKINMDDFCKLMDNSAQCLMSHSKHHQAIYLSGGIDSVLMTHFMHKNSKDALYTYNLFDSEDNEDRLYASLVSERLKTNHVEHKTNVKECLNFLDHYLYHYESLVTDGIFNVLGSLAFHLLSYEISKKFKVAYCGEGADELFGGYYWMHAHPLGLGDRIRMRSKKVNYGKTKINEYIMDKFPPDDSKEKEMQREIFDILMSSGLTNCHLWSVDRSSSAFSFEARPFFLYDDIRDWALSLPIENKVKNKNTKLVLKGYAYKSDCALLNDIASRKKIGMPAALSASMNKLIQYSEQTFRKIKDTQDLPHKAYSSFFNTDLERMLFDKFYKIFVENRGKQVNESEAIIPSTLQTMI